MAGNPDKGLRSLSTVYPLLSRPWWERWLFPHRFRNRTAAKLLRVLEIGANRCFTAYHLADNMGIGDIDGQCLVDEALRYLLLKGKIEQPYPGKFRIRDFYRVTGVVDLSIPHQPTLISGNTQRPVYIQPRCLHGAAHGDTVTAHISRGVNNSLEAEVLRVIKFAQRRMVGNLEVLEHRAYFTPLEKELFRDIEIPLSGIKNAVDGDRVVVDLDLHAQHRNKLTGKVYKVLGEADVEYVETLSRIEMNGFSESFTAEQEAAAAAIATDITEAEIAKRIDLRGVCTFTIDPKGTKDIDDALSIRPLGNDKWEVGIHIADLTHFIKAGSVLDQNARERTTSVYLADHVLPLFPDRITQCCSLSPQADRLAFSVLLEMNNNGKVLGRKIAKTVIRSQRQFSYHEAQWLLNGAPGEYGEEMNTLNEMAGHLRNSRIKNGAIFFEERPHLHFEFNSMGEVAHIALAKRNAAMMLIEEFMLLANRTVAEMMAKQHHPCLYRVHGTPNIKLYSELRRVAANYGYTIDLATNRLISANINKLLKFFRGKTEEMLFSNLAIRSMARGKYSTTPRRHFALAFDLYTHFTSPIRRYADVVTHRMLTRALVDRTEQTGILHYENLCSHLNFMREKAKMLEDYSEQQKCAEYLHSKINQEYQGVITHITPAMMAVQLSDSGIRGRVLLRTLLDDRYVMDTDTYVVTGIQSNNCYRTGTKVRIRVAHVNVHSGQIDFTLIEKTPARRRHRP